ncbi:unnamed protein product [Toxocara canis]|uniref:Fibrous sheath-interacting protein 1 n=1 Tax=Toxocara canis TaxID=6265 RepID=A0A183VB86_TOXCA|nr:unnamed protein product [Toxocara canis]
MDDEERQTPRRRGVGRTLPVGWKHMSPPSEEVRHKILQQILERVKKEQQGEHRIESVNCRKTELDDLKSRLFAELKEVVAKDKAQKASLSQQSTLSQAKEKHEPEASVDSSTTNVNAQQLDQLLDSAFDEIAADSSADNFFGADMLFVNEQLKMLCGDLMSSSEELLINSDYDENVPPNIQRASDWAIASVHEKNLPALKAGQVIAESDEKGHAVEQQTYG